MIKIQFEDLDFQNEAIDSIVDIFKGQSISKSNFTIEMGTGERVIIVTGCMNALRSRVSGTLLKNNSYIA